MKNDRKKELIACCMGIVRNADDIVRDMKYNQSLKVEITMNSNEAPNVNIVKTFIPEEVVKVYRAYSS